MGKESNEFQIILGSLIVENSLNIVEIVYVVKSFKPLNPNGPAVFLEVTLKSSYLANVVEVKY